jgi:glycosyltransferase involved in cell wall biosynthesis
MWWQSIAEAVAWLIGIGWCARAYASLRGLPKIADLSRSEWAQAAADQTPRLAVIVPALNEADNLRATLEALRDQQLPALQVVCVDDRSTDETGAIMDEFAREHPERFIAIHVMELPHGWLGKTHAMQVGLMACESEYVLFTDADVLFSPSVLQRAMTYALSTQADHLCVPPTLELKSWREAMVMGAFQAMSAWAVRPWKVSDPGAQRDAVGMGAFNMVRRQALQEIGGLAVQRLVVVEDIILGRRMKTARKRQEIAFAPGMIRLHWADGAGGLVGVMTKNLFAVFGFRLWLAAVMPLWLMAFFVAPVAGLFWWRTLLPSALALVSIASIYTTYEPMAGVPRSAVWSMPLGAFVMSWALLRSIVVTLKDGGVRWRGTLYRTRDLKAQNTPWRWMKRS